MKKIILPCLLFSLTLSSCYEKAKITIQNNVPNAVLQRINWDDYPIASSLLPGEKRTYTVDDAKSKFPKESVVKFYMKRGDNQVYLETKQIFTLNINDDILIVISDTTQVVNPALLK
ncbi:MAG: hypothetical protein FWC39_02805 [Bacteroidetes bacterium]|nr:hypothetical protein [Bacteroidota bacterium]